MLTGIWCSVLELSSYNNMNSLKKRKRWRKELTPFILSFWNPNVLSIRCVTGKSIIGYVKKKETPKQILTMAAKSNEVFPCGRFRVIICWVSENTQITCW